MTIQAVWSAVSGHQDQARCSSLVDDVDKRTSAHVRCRDAVRTRGLSPPVSSAFFQSSTYPCQEAAGARRMAAQRPSCRPASQTRANRARLDGNPPAQPEGHQKNPIAAPRSPAPATAPASPSDWPRPISDEAIPTLGGAARVGDSKPPPPWVQTSETRASKDRPGPLSPFFLAFRHLSPLGSCLCHSGPGRPRRLAAVRSARNDAVAFFGRLSCFLKHSSLTTPSQEAARGWGLVKPGKGHHRWTCPGYTLNQRSSQSLRPKHSRYRRPKHSCHLNPPCQSQPPSPAPAESHPSQADFDPVFNDMDNATAGWPCGRDPSQHDAEHTPPPCCCTGEGHGMQKKMSRTRTGTGLVGAAFVHVIQQTMRDRGYTRPDHVQFFLWRWSGEGLFPILRIRSICPDFAMFSIFVWCSGGIVPPRAPICSHQIHGCYPNRRHDRQHPAKHPVPPPVLKQNPTLPAFVPEAPSFVHVQLPDW